MRLLPVQVSTLVFGLTLLAAYVTSDVAHDCHVVFVGRGYALTMEIVAHIRST